MPPAFFLEYRIEKIEEAVEARPELMSRIYDEVHSWLGRSARASGMLIVGPRSAALELGREGAHWTHLGLRASVLTIL